MKKQLTAAEIAAEEAEAELQRLAAEKKKEYDSRPGPKIHFLEKQISNLKRLGVDTEQSIRSSIKDINSRGEIFVRSVPGIATDCSLNAIIRSNAASRRERVNAIDEAIELLQTFIKALKPTGSGEAPEDLEAFCADLLAKLPDRDEEELVYAPEPKKDAPAAEK